MCTLSRKACMRLQTLLDPVIQLAPILNKRTIRGVLSALIDPKKQVSHHSVAINPKASASVHQLEYATDFLWTQLKR